MSNIEEDYNLFQLVKRNSINSCIDLSKNMIGKKRGVFYFTERFRIDFENKMSDFERLKAEREQDKKRIKELEEENKIYILNGDNVKLELYIKENYIPVQKVKDKIEELKKDYEDSKDENGETEYYYPDYTIRKLEELLEEK